MFFSIENGQKLLEAIIIQAAEDLKEAYMNEGCVAEYIKCDSKVKHFRKRLERARELRLDETAIKRKMCNWMTRRSVAKNKMNAIHENEMFFRSNWMKIFNIHLDGEEMIEKIKQMAEREKQCHRV